MEGDRMSQLERKRERDNKIGKLMGEYLLKGYKMLGSTCNVCSTILLKDRKQQDYCIGCNEVDNYPTQSVTQTRPLPQNQHESEHCIDTGKENRSDQQQDASIAIEVTSRHNATPSEAPPHLMSIDNAIVTLQERLSWAVGQLGAANSVEIDIKLCELISSCGNALRTLKDLQH